VNLTCIGLATKKKKRKLDGICSHYFCKIKNLKGIEKKKKRKKKKEDEEDRKKDVQAKYMS
jgi:hypothetical protein